MFTDLPSVLPEKISRSLFSTCVVKKVSSGPTGHENADIDITRSPPSSGKRKRDLTEDTIEDTADALSSDIQWTSYPLKRTATPSRPKIFSGIQLPQLVYPRSHYQGWAPPISPSREHTVLRDLRQEQTSRFERETHDADTKAEYQSFELDLFTIYKPEQLSHPHELAPLHHLSVRSANNVYLFDGILREGAVERYVQGVPFRLVAVGGYCDDDCHTVDDQLWIQSRLAEHQGTHTWYQLREPAPEYARYHVQFVWLANFAKFFVDFLTRRQSVRIHHLRRDFYHELMALHGHVQCVRDWLASFGHTDFRRVVTANTEFLFREAVTVDVKNRKHPIWSEVDPKDLRAILSHPMVEQHTIVTPYVYKCFSHLRWGHHLLSIEPSYKIRKARRQLEQALHLTVDESEPASPRSRKSADTTDSDPTIEHKAAKARFKFVGPVISPSSGSSQDCSEPSAKYRRPKSVRVGDVVGVRKDQCSAWKGSADLWYAYVQNIRTNKAGKQLLDVIWLYEPSDTTCSTMRYPIQNELFFSDNCNCGNAQLTAEDNDIVCKLSVAFFAMPGASKADYLIRQKYLTDDASFVTFKQSDLQCCHQRPVWKSDLEDVMEKFQKGNTILYRVSERGIGETLEVGEIVDFQQDGPAEIVILRKLTRRSREQDRSNIRSNELVYTSDIIPVPASDITRKCHVRFYTTRQLYNRQIPAPYSRDGTGDAFYITCKKREDGLEEIDVNQSCSLIEGFDPNAPPPRPTLKGLDLFCGGGNFGRGLEEGGAVEHHWAVDFDRDAIHTYHANLKRPDQTALYFGSVNDFLAGATQGRFTVRIPSPGDVDYIVAGSPCVGFSVANQNRSSEASLRNCSLVASVAAFIDFYRPKYALLENVISMATKGARHQDENVFSQVLCCLVGMGYQVQQFNLDAWSFGSPQSRSRIFISIAAPGLQLPPHPVISHSHPEGKKDRALGVASNGVPFGRRRFESTPFQHVTAEKATRDLPHIGDARTQTCIPHPDHRNSRFESGLVRTQISHIPVMPRGQSFISAYHRGRLSQPEIDAFTWSNKFKASKKSRAWQRIDPNGLLPCITTSATPGCSFSGTILHWDQHRLLSILEARRAQGFPDEEVLVGLPRVQWKIVGNSVPRTVALALGLSLREAWLNDAEESNDPRSDLVDRRTPKRLDFERKTGIVDLVMPEKNQDENEPSLSAKKGKAENDLEFPSATSPRDIRPAASSASTVNVTSRVPFSVCLPLRSSSFEDWRESDEPVGGLAGRKNDNSMDNASIRDPVSESIGVWQSTRKKRLRRRLDEMKGTREQPLVIDD
ncbi:MAG: DNA methyltransferase Dim-2 [Caeruleum heppii]|nr:MAG: DNA methyltransferase Dim-2 [Caeruleum heppii]